MTVGKAFIYQITCPITNKTRTILIQPFITEDLIPKFEIMAFDGIYKTRSQFNKELEKYREDVESGISVEPRSFDWIAFDGADFMEFIEKCEYWRNKDVPF